MRGGAIPYLVWGTLLVVFLVINWIWTGDSIQIATFGFAAFATYITGIAFIASRREAVRRGAPPPDPAARGVPTASLSAVGVGVSAAMILFGLAWAHFLIFFGGGLLLLSLGRLAVELRAELRTRRRLERGQTQ